MKYVSIKNWSQDDQPREKLMSYGANILSKAELISILIKNGHKNKSAVDIAKDILALSKNELNELGKLTVNELMAIKGIGKAKAITIAAALELGRRCQSSPISYKTKIKSFQQVLDILQSKLRDYTAEAFIVIYLNRAYVIKQIEEISKGGIDQVLVDVRIVMQKALAVRASYLILCHNHPSGSVEPSQADRDLTFKFIRAGLVMDIKVKDHIIISDEGYWSFEEEQTKMRQQQTPSHASQKRPHSYTAART